MPEEATAPSPETEAPAPSPPESEGDPSEQPDGNEWLRETAQGLIYSRPLDTAKRSQEWAEANAELRRGRKGKAEDGTPSSDGDESRPDAAARERPASGREPDDAAFQRRVQAEVDRREAVRRQRDEAQRERDLRQQNPEAYAKYKESQEGEQAAAQALNQALMQVAKTFDETAITPLVNALPEAARAEVLRDPGHAMEGRKTIVTRAIDALKKAAYDDGFAKGREAAQKSLRRSSAFRKELLAEAREAEDEPELAPGNGSLGEGYGFDMNDFMRGALGKRSRASNRE